MGANEGFDIGQFESFSGHSNAPLRNFPLQIEAYDLTGSTHFVVGTDLSSGRRVRVFLRPQKSDKAKARAEIWHYATDPYRDFTDADFRNKARMMAVAETLEAKCFTEPGGVLMVQAAYDDPATGAVSANWINRIVSTREDLSDGSTMVFSPIMARLSTPIPPKEGTTGTAYCYCDLLFPDKTSVAKTDKELDEVLFQALSITASATGKYLAVIRLVNVQDGRSSSMLIERRSEKHGDNTYSSESPNTTISRFWQSLPPDFASGMKQALADRRIEALVIPGSRFRLVGETLKALDKEPNYRVHLPYERFALSEPAGESGFMPATVVLGRFKAAEGAPAGDEDYFVKSVYPMDNKSTPVKLGGLKL